MRSLVETGSLVGERGAYRLARPLPTIQVPATVQAVLAARIDRLPPADRAVLQTASVVGKDVPLGLLQAIAEQGEAELSRRDRAAPGRRVPLRDAHLPGRRVHVQACPDARRHLRRPAPGAPPTPARPDRGDDRAALSRPARRARRAAGPPRVSGRGVGEGGRLPAAGRGQGPGPVGQPGGRRAHGAGARGAADTCRSPPRPWSRRSTSGSSSGTRSPRSGSSRGPAMWHARRRRRRGAARRPATARSSLGVDGQCSCGSPVAGPSRRPSPSGPGRRARRSGIWSRRSRRTRTSVSTPTQPGTTGGPRRSRRRILQLIPPERVRERFGRALLPAVNALSNLAAALAQRGVFDEAVRHGQAAIELAEEVGHPYSLAVACWHARTRSHAPGRPCPGQAAPESGALTGGGADDRLPDPRGGAGAECALGPGRAR